jgi:hypothetical protein
MAKVLHIQFTGMEPLDDPETCQIDTEIKIMESGQTVFSSTVVAPQVTLKNALGTYKLPATLNSEAIAAAQAYLLDAFGQSGFDKVYVRGGFSSAL